MVRFSFLFSSPPCRCHTVLLHVAAAPLLSSAPPPHHCPPTPPPLIRATTVLPRRPWSCRRLWSRRRHDPTVAPPVAAPPPRPRSSCRHASPLLTPPLHHSRHCSAPSPPSIRYFIRQLIPSLNPPCHGREKRKGMEPVVEPLKKKETHSQKEAERAAMAADDQAAGRGHRLQIRKPGARTREQ
jgi:hypothetical protein